MSESALAGLFAMGVGAFAVSAAFFNWDWFMMHRKARFVTAICGRTGARIFYGVLGTAFFAAGVGMLVGLVR